MSSYIVRSEDSQWFATSDYTFSPYKKDAIKFSEKEANDMVKSISSVKLIKEAA